MLQLLFDCNLNYSSYVAMSIDPTEDTRVHYLWTDITSPQIQQTGPVCITFQYLNQVSALAVSTSITLLKAASPFDGSVYFSEL